MTMRPTIIGIMSCWNDKSNGSHDACRKTWLTGMAAVPGLDYRFFIGRGTGTLEHDEIQLDIPDGPDSNGGTPEAPGLCEKAQAMRVWALERSYDFMLKVDRDTYVSPRRFCESGFERHDYVGYFPYIPGGSGSGFKHHQTPEGYVPAAADTRGAYIYASGGAGYSLSKQAMEALVAAPLDDKRLDVFGHPAEDLFIPNVIFPLGLRGYHDPRYLFMGDRLVGDAITVHLGIGGYHTDKMYRCHELSKGAL